MVNLPKATSSRLANIAANKAAQWSATHPQNGAEVKPFRVPAVATTFDEAHNNYQKIFSAQGASAASQYAAQNPAFFGQGSGAAEAARRGAGTVSYYQPVERVSPSEATIADEFGYEGQISANQLKYLREWAAGKGARLEIGAVEKQKYENQFFPSSKKQNQFFPSTTGKTKINYKIISKAPLAPAGQGVSISMPSSADINRQEMDVQRGISAERLYKEATPIGKAQMHIMASVGPEAEEYAGSLAGMSLPKIKPVLGFKKIAGMGKFPKKETKIITDITPEEVVVKTLKTELAFKDKSMPEKWLRKSYEVAVSPPGSIATAAAGGFGAGAVAGKVASVAAPKIPAVVLPATKLAATGVGMEIAAAMTLPAVVDITETQAAGRTAEARGKTAGLVGGLVAGGAGFSLGLSRGLRLPEVKLHDVKIAGMSQTAIRPTGEAVSSGRFLATPRGAGAGPGEGIRGFTLGVSESTGKGRGIQNVVTKIPEQKVFIGGKKYSVEEATSYAMNRVVKAGTKAAPRYAAQGSEGTIDVDVGGAYKRVLAGAKRSSSNIVETSSARKGKATVRTYTATASESAGKLASRDLLRSVKLAKISDRAPSTLDVPRSGVKMSSLQEIKWVDISESVNPPRISGPKGRAGSLISSGSAGSAPKGRAGTVIMSKVPAPALPSIPKLKISAPAVKLPNIRLPSAAASAGAYTSGLVSRAKAKIVPSYHYSPGIVRMAEPESVQIALPGRAQIARPRQKQKFPSASAIRVVMPSLPEFKENVQLKDVKLPNIQEYFTGSAERQAQGSASRQASATKSSYDYGTETVNVPPIDVPAIDDTPPPPGLGFPFPPFSARYPKGRKGRVGVRWIKNPVPETLKINLPDVRLPKIRKII